MFKLYSDYYLDFNRNDLIVTGKLNQVDNTKYDFREFTRLGDKMIENGRWPDEGFDNFFIINQQSGNKMVAS